jgi:hypothetical protein
MLTFELVTMLDCRILSVEQVKAIKLAVTYMLRSIDEYSAIPKCVGVAVAAEVYGMRKLPCINS